eukprot:767320-Hanusia_phi.AAC.13
MRFLEAGGPSQWSPGHREGDCCGGALPPDSVRVCDVSGAGSEGTIRESVLYHQDGCQRAGVR